MRNPPGHLRYPQTRVQLASIMFVGVGGVLAPCLQRLFEQFGLTTYWAGEIVFVLFAVVFFVGILLSERLNSIVRAEDEEYRVTSEIINQFGDGKLTVNQARAAIRAAGYDALEPEPE